MNRLEGETNSVWDKMRVPVSVGKQSEVESIRCVILGTHVGIYTGVGNWEQDQMQAKLLDLNSHPG